MLARRRFRGKGWLEAVVDLPIVLPPSVAGLALLLAFGRRGVLATPLDLLGVSIPFTTVAVVLAQTFVSAPFFIRSARTGLAGVDRDLEDAARVRRSLRIGALPSHHRATRGRRPRRWHRDGVGSSPRRIRCDDHVRRERQGRTQTLPLVVYSEFQGGDLDESIAAASILVLAAFGVLLAVRVFHWGRVLDARGLA